MTITLAILGLVALVGLFKVAQFVAWRWRRRQVWKPPPNTGLAELETMARDAELAAHVHRCRLCGVEFRHRKKSCVSLSGRECPRCAHELRESFWMGGALGVVIGGAGAALLFIFLGS